MAYLKQVSASSGPRVVGYKVVFSSGSEYANGKPIPMRKALWISKHVGGKVVPVVK